jgi:hypothetical protein
VLDRRECFIDVAAVPAGELLGDWRWLVGDPEYAVVRATAFGDLFLRDPTGRVLLLDTMEGTLKPFAPSERDLDAALDDRLVRQKVLMPWLVEELREAGRHLGPGECYSPDVPPVLGGAFDAENLRPTDLLAHLAFMGQTHRQVRGLPPETRITDVHIQGLRPEPGGGGWREPLMVAAVLTVLGLLFAAAMLDGGRLARQTQWGYVFLWAGIAAFTAVRRRPSRSEKVLVALAPLAVETAILATQGLAR